MKARIFATVAVAALLGAAPVTTFAAAAKTVAAAPDSIPFRSAEVMTLAEKVANYQLATMAGGAIPAKASPDTPNKTGWVQGALFVGLTEMADHSSNPIYKETILARGAANNWQLGPTPYHADDHVIGQSYLWASRNGAGPEAIAPLKARFDSILAFPPQVGLEHREYTDPRGVDCDERWCWSDALFMAPAAWLELSKVTGDARYADYAKKEFVATTDYLYDKDEHLYYRDSRFFTRRGPDGEKVFWSRGDGWVFAGLARMIPLLPQGDPGRVRMETVFKEMAASLKTIQKPDGYWSPSLLSDPSKSLPESSGTGFFTYGFAWGIKAGLLDQKAYEPTVRKGWTALVRAVHPNGKLGWVQPVSDRPESVSYDDTQFYGVGAFLLAATAVADLDLKPGKDLTVQREVVTVQAVLNVQDGGRLVNNVITGGVFRPEREYTVPADHFIHDGRIAFEGLGWENDLVAYRLYLDERMAIDIFGKKTPGPVLQNIGQGVDNYHEMAPWGMDIFKVGETVGIGGIGVLRGGKAAQLGKAVISVKVLESGSGHAVSQVTNTGFDSAASRLVTTLDITQGSALTRVKANATGTTQPLVTGLIKHPGVTVLKGEAGAGGWAYIASWGKQSLAEDDLGIAVFYKPGSVAGGPQDDGSTVFVTFKDPAAIDYAFGIAWTQDQQGVKTLDGFKSWLTARQAELAKQ
ncbi:glycosyl Hydrolase Family 88 family protein [Asticcacaulis biprosthecium C19]|uniref:Glycosyl Hydrolase Family 88 family protein n=1 Tax=Asticcacaulis biprosthecium C19 TaxID=715226 RepID=F4QIA0_9CAUL|nr:glycoside hydrolase family 88 protein [Asticcacaulis biprosthecium]EGF91738.1 glycosyl Hydrolase Family 88 family protein [Asticcacaulis biprosthecium C19]